jgi:DNA-binding protein H-NS
MTSNKSEGEEAMKSGELKAMSVETLWSLHEQIEVILRCKLAQERARLDQRMRRLNKRTGPSGHTKRPCPHVFPKFQNPDRPSETWAGRGKQPRWLTAQLGSGKKLEEFRVKLS